MFEVKSPLMTFSRQNTFDYVKKCGMRVVSQAQNSYN